MITIVVLDYLSANRTEAFLDAMADKIETKDEVSFVVVDNSINKANSDTLFKCIYKAKIEEDESFQQRIIKGVWKRTGIPCIFYINSENSGYAKGNNLGVDIAWKNFQPDYTIISNNDIICMDQKLDLKKISKLFQDNNRIGCIGPQIIGKRGEFQSPAKYVSIEDRWIKMMFFYPLGRVFGLTANDLIEHPRQGVVYRIMGSFMVFKTEVFLAVKGFDERTFLFAEENIIAEKLKKAGYVIYYTDELHMLHNHGETINKNYKELAKMKMKFKSEMIYYKNYVKVNRIKIIVAKFLFPFFLTKFSIFNRLKTSGDKIHEN